MILPRLHTGQVNDPDNNDDCEKEHGPRQCQGKGRSGTKCRKNQGAKERRGEKQSDYLIACDVRPAGFQNRSQFHRLPRCGVCMSTPIPAIITEG